jgi:pimeloyl-ACP methyl ester carboxylesterase
MIERPRSRPSWTAVGFEKAVLFGMSEGGPASIVFAAKRPERTRALILYGSNSFLVPATG